MDSRRYKYSFNVLIDGQTRILQDSCWPYQIARIPGEFKTLVVCCNKRGALLIYAENPKYPPKREGLIVNKNVIIDEWYSWGELKVKRRKWTKADILEALEYVDGFCSVPQDALEELGKNLSRRADK